MSSWIEAVIFDFNGTLFRDAAFHDAAWSAFGQKHGVFLSPTELESRVIGFTNQEILEYLFKGRLAPEETLRLSREKEALYRDICLAHPDRCALAPGAEALLDFLLAQRIKRTIATASIIENVRFFFEVFDLKRWFELNEIAYDNGVLRGKPFPDMFLAAAEALGVTPNRCMVIEDSVGGVRGAINAGAKRVVAVVPKGASNTLAGMSGIHQIVSDFGELDRTVFTRESGQTLLSVT